MPKMLFNIRWKEGKPTIPDLCERFDLVPGEVDGKFGVIEIDPQDHLYAIRVEEEAAERLGAAASTAPDVEGPFADTRIAPFGPPED